MNLFEQFKNISFISLIELDFGKVIWDIDKQTKEEYYLTEKNLINNHKNVFMIKFQWNEENSYLINNYDIANLFKNNLFDLIVIKIDYDKAFVEFLCENDRNEKDYNNILSIITEIKNNNNNINNKLIINDIYPYENFILEYKNFLK